jgi:hypothetical protein
MDQMLHQFYDHLHYHLYHLYHYLHYHWFEVAAQASKWSIQLMAEDFS